MLSRVHPLAKLIVCMVWIAASTLVFDARFQIVTIVLVAGCLVIVEGISPFAVLALMVPFYLFGLGFLTTSLLFHRESDFAVHVAGEAMLSSTGLAAGIVLFLRAIACGMASAFFAMTTDPGLFVRALMAQWRLPPRIGYALFSALLLVPDLAAEAQQMRQARAMRRGVPLHRFAGPFEIASLFVPLLAFAIRRAGRAAIAMEARGLAASTPRTVIGAPRFGRGDAIFTLAASALLAAALGWIAVMPG